MFYLFAAHSAKLSRYMSVVSTFWTYFRKNNFFHFAGSISSHLKNPSARVHASARNLWERLQSCLRLQKPERRLRFILPSHSALLPKSNFGIRSRRSNFAIWSLRGDVHARKIRLRKLLVPPQGMLFSYILMIIFDWRMKKLYFFTTQNDDGNAMKHFLVNVLDIICFKFFNISGCTQVPRST